MFCIQYIIYFILLHFIIATPQFNLHYTDVVSKSNNALQHNCLLIVNSTGGFNRINRQKLRNNPNTRIINQEIISYCMNEFTPKFHSEEKTDHFRKFTFNELSKQNISSEQLYFWSAPIDLIENYQFYLNQLSTFNDLSLSNESFYNCTLPRFGPQCQYELEYSHLNHSNLSEVIHQFYTTNKYNSTTPTCYAHLMCYSGLHLKCLDWIDICNGVFDCTNSEFDEEHCWQLEVNVCNDNEYQCDNGQCIPNIFYRDDQKVVDCIDASDEDFNMNKYEWRGCDQKVPAFGCEDRMCEKKLCVTNQRYLLTKTLFLAKGDLTEDCWFAIKCMFNQSYSEEPSCYELHAVESFLDTCPKMLYIPNYPILFGDTYIAVEKSKLKEMLNSNNFSFYICYNHHSNYDDFIHRMPNIRFKNTTCFESSRLGVQFHEINSKPKEKYDKLINYTYSFLQQYRIRLNYSSTICNRSNMYQCMNSSKCVPIRRFHDNAFNGCPNKDKLNTSVINNDPRIKEQIPKSHFYCPSLNKYLPRRYINDYMCHCRGGVVKRCIDENVGDEDTSRDILFQNICDGFQELHPIIIENRTETDETECEQWECHNMYTHCNGAWNCRNGEDELGCDELSRSMCSLNEHLCISLSTFQLSCLNISKVNDGNLDCVGGTDERRRVSIASSYNDSTIYEHTFTCMNHTFIAPMSFMAICDGKNFCDHGDDEKFCETDQTYFPYPGICIEMNIEFASDAEKLICSFLLPQHKNPLIYFKLNTITDAVKKISENVVSSSLSTIKISPQDKFRCHRGLSLRVWTNTETALNNTVCLCPPSYYGDYCQYQNQRISLVMRFRAFADSWQTQFVIIILLIDGSDDRIIHSYEQINYLPLRNCQTKFNIHLLYSTRPKDITKNYSIHIDIFERKTLSHRGSLLFPVLFPFLPVHRLAFIVDIPLTTNTENQICSNQRCNHGKCIKYYNDLTFCQCEQGWSGRFCTKQYTHKCSSDSLCIGISPNNRSICVCPSDKFGSRCLLTVNTICQINNHTVCQNGGECIPKNPNIISDKEFTCFCLRGFKGDRCEINDNEFRLSFNKDIALSQVIFIHFIRIKEKETHSRLTTFRSIPVAQNVITITWSEPFNIIFIDLSNKNYYLVVVQNSDIVPEKMNKMINPSDRCPYITDFKLFKKPFTQWHIRRIKYYHLLCQDQSLNVSCFHDDFQVCLCYQFGQKRLANCFGFDHNMTFNCEGKSVCENGGKCFQDDLECPTRSVCMCPSCFFGQRCHLTTNGYGLSLDVILGYQILPHMSITHQLSIIKISLAITIIFMIAGLINGVLSLITFMNKTVRNVGCGLYLLGSSITTLLITVMFGLKFFILLFSHMSIISNRLFISGQCYSFDYILRIFLAMDQWLNACVAVERTITVIKGVSFDTKKSKKAAKFVIIILLVVVAISYVHDPIHRKLIPEINDDDNRQNRLWCIVSYSPALEIYSHCIHIFHVTGPFIINLVSVIILILKKTRQESNLRDKQPYKEILRKTIKEHRHLLTAPIVLVIFGIPRIILIFISPCMQSAGDVWLLLIGYFISFIPPMLIFLIFILPSTLYKQTLRTTINRYITNIRRYFGLIQ